MSLPETKTSPLAAPAGRDEAGLRRPVSAVWGVGEERAKLLARLNIFTVEDLLLHKPRRYEDRRKFLPIRDLKLKEAATVRGTIIAAGVKRFRKGARAMFECVFDDGTAHLHCRWWQAQPWMEDWYAVGREFLIFGKPDSLKPRNMDHPETEFVEPGEDEFIHVNRIVPIHPLTDGLTARVMRALVWRALEKFESEIVEPLVGRVTPCAPSSAIPERHARSDAPYQFLPSRANAVRMIHFPNELTDVEIARQRLALDEFVALQFQIQSRRKKFEMLAKALPCGGDNQLMKPFLAELGFKLTGRANECAARNPRGHGRRASDAAVVARRCRFRQNRRGGVQRADGVGKRFQRRADGTDGNSGGTALSEFYKMVRTAGREGGNANRKPEERRGWKMEDGRVENAFARPTLNSHILHLHRHPRFVHGGFDLPKLGLVIIDEQHKFGVAQRETLVRKGNYPHLLVMTATPIPRTLGLTLYGDLDVSVIDELPGGRGEIKTFVRPADKLPKVWEFIREKISAGRQALHRLSARRNCGHGQRHQGRDEGVWKRAARIVAVPGRLASWPHQTAWKRKKRWRIFAPIKSRRSWQRH